MTDHQIKFSPLHPLTPHGVMGEFDLAEWGLEDVAYAKPAEIDGEDVYSIHSADGQTLDVVAGREAAFAAILVNDLVALSVH